MWLAGGMNQFNSLESFTDHSLARALDALSSPVRIAIVRALEEPRRLSEIDVDLPRTRRGAVLRGGVLARQTLKQHIDRLTRSGIVTTRKVKGRRGETTEYSLNPEAILDLSEACRDLAVLLSKPAPMRLPTPTAVEATPDVIA